MSALNFYESHHYFDEQVKYLKDGMIHCASVNEGESDDPSSLMQLIATRESADSVSYIGMARLLSVNGLACRDDGRILLACYTFSPGHGTIMNLFVLRQEGSKLQISEPEEIAGLHGDVALKLVSLKRARFG
jgi:hypothetical protein